jgi:lipoate---protein ligase
MTFSAFRSASVDPYWNLALEEALLEAESAPAYALFLYINDPCLVIGRNQNPWAEIAADAGLPILRRVSGGGTVYQDRGNLNWALVLPRLGHDPEAEIALVARALAPLGIKAAVGPRGGLYLRAEGPLDGRKISGTARRMTASRVLHHGTLLVDADLGRLGRSLGGLTPALSRALPSRPALPANLAEFLPGLELEVLARALALGICGSPACMDAETAIRSIVDPGRIESISERLRSWEWCFGATPPFSIRVDTPAGFLELELRGGQVSACSGPGAGFLPEGERKSLLGTRFDYRLPARLALLYEKTHSALYSRTS